MQIKFGFIQRTEPRAAFFSVFVLNLVQTQKAKESPPLTGLKSLFVNFNVFFVSNLFLYVFI
jgi:hypothetical protein